MNSFYAQALQYCQKQDTETLWELKQGFLHRNYQRRIRLVENLKDPHFCTLALDSRGYLTTREQLLYSATQEVLQERNKDL